MPSPNDKITVEFTLDQFGEVVEALHVAMEHVPSGPLAFTIARLELQARQYVREHGAVEYEGRAKSPVSAQSAPKSLKPTPQNAPGRAQGMSDVV